MKKIIITLIFTLMSMSSVSFADGHSGKISLAGFFVGDAKAIVDEKGNIMTFTYEGLSGFNAIEGTSFGDNSSHHCIGAGSMQNNVYKW
jgi:hypothetical protein